MNRCRRRRGRWSPAPRSLIRKAHSPIKSPVADRCTQQFRALRRSGHIAPNLPPDWDAAELTTPDIAFVYRHSGQQDIVSKQRSACRLGRYFAQIVSSDNSSKVFPSLVTNRTPLIGIADALVDQISRRKVAADQGGVLERPEI